MSGLAKVQLIGNLGRDPELRYTPKGTAVTNFSLAVNTKNGDTEKTSWFRVTVWGAQAETMSKHLVKGQQIYLSGDIELSTFETKDGKNGASMEVTAREIVFLSGKPEGKAVAAAAGKPAAPPVDDSEIPF